MSTDLITAVPAGTIGAMKTVDPLKILAEMCAQSSVRKVAIHLGVSAQYVSEVLRGLKEPGDGILKPLGLRRVVRYERIPAAELAEAQSPAAPRRESLG